MLSFKDTVHEPDGSICTDFGSKAVDFGIKAHRVRIRENYRFYRCLSQGSGYFQLKTNRASCNELIS